MLQVHCVRYLKTAATSSSAMSLWNIVTIEMSNPWSTHTSLNGYHQWGHPEDLRWCNCSGAESVRPSLFQWAADTTTTCPEGCLLQSRERDTKWDIGERDMERFDWGKKILQCQRHTVCFRVWKIWRVRFLGCEAWDIEERRCVSFLIFQGLLVKYVLKLDKSMLEMHLKSELLFKGQTSI